MRKKMTSVDELPKSREKWIDFYRFDLKDIPHVCAECLLCNIDSFYTFLCKSQTIVTDKQVMS